MAGATATTTTDIPLFLGSGPLITRIRRDISRAAKSDAKVLITGESGVGKEIVARCIHAQSRRNRADLITINCAGVPDSLLEAEFFGHVRGSFTGAYRDSPGVLSLADRGTLFLDEVGEMSARMQALLLRFLDTGEIHRVGTTGIGKRVDVRIIAATNRHLPERMADGEFRADLYYRLNVVHLQVPPLRERREDIPALLESFLRMFATQQHAPVPKCHPDLLRQLMSHDWSGNVRELRNVAERMVLLTEENAHDLEQLLPSQPPSTPVELMVPISSRAMPPGGAAGLFHRMVRDGEVFWDVVHGPFLSRDLTRAEIRELVRQGLEITRGSYKQLVDLFNMPPDDYKRFLSFLRKYDCQLRFQDFRSGAVGHAELERAV